MPLLFQHTKYGLHEHEHKRPVLCQLEFIVHKLVLFLFYGLTHVLQGGCLCSNAAVSAVCER